MINFRLSPSRIIFNIFNYTFFVLLSLLCIYPIWYIFIYSISVPSVILKYGVTLVPRSFTINNYEKFFMIQGVFKAFGISVLRTVIGMISTVFACTFLGYLFSRQMMPFRSALYRILIATMYISGGLIPTYLTMQSYGLLNNFAVYILPTTVSAFYVILIKTYIEQLPPSMEESARIDGANTFVIVTKIIAPLSIPIIATIAVYVCVAQWNSWFDNHIYTFRNKNLLTLQYMLYNYLQEVESLIKMIEQLGSENVDITKILTPKGVRMTATMVTVMPILCIYPIMQRFFLKGLMIGAVKG